MDKLGAHSSTLIFAVLTLCGQLIFAIGTSVQSWNIMLLGRVVYGFGGENISVATSTLNTKWFRGKELALSFGINLAVSRLGSVFNNLISPRVANARGAPLAVWFGVFMNLLSVVCALVICMLTWKNDRLSVSVPLPVEQSESEMLTGALLENDGLNHDHVDNMNSTAPNVDDNINVNGNGNGNPDEETNELMADATAKSLNDENPSEQENGQEPDTVNVITNNNDTGTLTCLNHVKKFGIMFWLLSASCLVVYGCVLPFNNIVGGILLERNYFKSSSTGSDSDSDCQLKYPNECTSGTLEPFGNPSIDSRGNNCTLEQYSQPILPMSLHVNREGKEYTNAKKWDQSSYDFDNLTENEVDCGDSFWKDACTKDFCDAQARATEISGRIMSIPYFISATLSPFCGYVVDKIGLRAIIASMASIVLICVHLTLALTDSSPVLPLIGQGVAYTCYAAVIWPSVPLTTSEDSLGTAFGAITAIQNFGLALFPLIIAYIYTASGDRYIPSVEYFFVACAVVGTVVGILLNVFDKRSGGKLNICSQNED